MEQMMVNIIIIYIKLAPALSKSDVGYSLGIAGTEIAKESSGIILLDDNVHSIYKGLILARNLLDSIKRLAQY